MLFSKIMACELDCDWEYFKDKMRKISNFLEAPNGGLLFRKAYFLRSQQPGLLWGFHPPFGSKL